jgi:hypothetical protein
MRYEVPAEPASGTTIATPKREYVRTEIGWEDTAPRRSRQGFSWQSLVLKYPLTLDGHDISLPGEPPIGATLYGKGRTFTRYADGWTDDPTMGRYEWGALLWDMGPLSDQP